MAAVTKLFPNCMPLGDLDHMMHHVMGDGETAFAANNDLWTVFDKQINGLAKIFSKKDCCERFVQKCIIENAEIPGYAKRGLSSMFEKTCPTYCKNRWHFAFEVFHWISSRGSLLEYLGPESVNVGDDITAAEVDALKQLSSNEHRHRFWAIFWTFYSLQSWGFGVHTFAHACPCPHHQNLTREERKHVLKSPCKMNGRRMIDLACGKCSQMYSDLKKLRPQDHPKALQALKCLAEIEPESAQRIESSFLSAKSAMLLRFWQGTSFYDQYPWNLPKLLSFLLVPAEHRHGAILESQAFAGELIQSFSEGQLQTGTFADKFFHEQGPFKHALTTWSTSGGGGRGKQ